MNIFLRVFEGITAAFKGMASVAGFGILAVLLPVMMLKMKGSEGKEIVRAAPKITIVEASLAEAPVLVAPSENPKVIENLKDDSTSFSFGTSDGFKKNDLLIDRSWDPNK